MYSLVGQTGRALLLPRRVHVVHAEVLEQRAHVHEVEERLEAHICKRYKG